MRKKEYQKPSLKIVVLEQASSLLALSDTETGYRQEYEGDDVDAVNDLIWDR